MPSLDLNFDYNKIQKRVVASQSYADIKSQYNSANKKVGDSFEKTKSQVSESLTSVKEQTKRYQKQIKNQFEQLLDLSNVTGGNGSGSPKYIKRLLIRTIKNVQPRLRTIVIKDCLTALGCDQQQTYTPGPVYVKVSSIDLFNRLLIDPQDEVGVVIYERKGIQLGQVPFSMNRQLHQLTMTPTTQYTHVGKSGQELCTIKYMENLPLALGGATGPWFEVDLKNRSNPLKVGEFMVDYYDTIRMTDDTDVIASIMESLSGAISMKIDAGISQVENASKFELILARILGLCFDNRGNEIDTSGIAKVPELDGAIDDAFFEFTEIDLRNIETRVQNIKNGVIQFEDCDDVLLPVNFDDIISALGTLNYYEGSEFEDAADTITDVLANNPAWIGAGININPQVVVDTNFIKLITNGMIGALITPK
ncbi:MAG: YtxH domain-containing protein, partial [Flavobacteriaceae bacterium]|nr:YtxH domain-containing protein [Flavobacteriaceae bacterium]